MRLNYYIVFLFVLLIFSQNKGQEALGQGKREFKGPENWELNKQEDGISIYTARQKGSHILAYRIEAEIQGSIEEVYRQVIDFQANKKHLETIKEIRVLEKKPNQEVLVYMLFDLPWPFRDRDFVNRMELQVGQDTIVLNSRPVTNRIKPQDGVVRMREFSEQWLLTSQGKDATQLSLRGHADPGGSFPDWVINRFVVKEPLALVKGIKLQVEHNR